MNKTFSIQPTGVITLDGVEVFQSSVSQQHAREVLHETCEEFGYEVVEEWEMDDDSIELTVKK
tara:strand:+ start:2163 stop:2351 length:189 start_codon:yes stop_codon:yes gene_type:complete